MADTKQSPPQTTQQGTAGRVPAATEAVGSAVQNTAGTAAQVSERAAQRGAETMREGGQAAAGMLRQASDAAGRSGEALGETARSGVQAAASNQSRLMQGAAQELEKAGRGLAGMAEEAAASVRQLMTTVPGFGTNGVQDAQQAMSRLVEGVMATNMRFAEQLLSRTGPSAVVELQRRFLREYFDALAQGGTLLLRAALQTAEQSLRPLEQQIRERAQQNSGGQVGDIMSKDVKLASPEDTVQQAARQMSEQDTGALPVGENDRLVGMVTDRDLALRAAAAGKDPAKTKLREVMTGGEPRYVFDDESVEKAAASMAEQQVQRMPVLNRDKRLVGMLSLGDLAREGGRDVGGQALAGIARPGGQHTGGPNGAAAG